MAPYRTKEKQKEQLKHWREKNYNKFQQQWLNPKHRHKRNANAATRRARIRNLTTNNSNIQIIQEIYYKCKQISEETGILHEVDHIIPIAKGGLHHQDNLQILTKIENRSKGSK